jgi:hypothetical protein
MRIRGRIEQVLQQRALLLPFIAALITTLLAILAMVKVFP